MTSLHIDTTLFILLYMSMAFDWIYQTAEEGLGKFDNWRIRARHAFKYSALTYVLISLFGYCTWWGLCIWLTLFGTHFMIDDRKAVKWLMKKVKMIGDREMDSLWWMQIKIDQWLHMIVNFLLAVVSYYVMAV